MGDRKANNRELPLRMRKCSDDVEKARDQSGRYMLTGQVTSGCAKAGLLERGFS